MTTLERPQTRRWTRREYEWAAEAGMFRPEERLELLDGEVLLKARPQSHSHAASVTLSNGTFRLAFGPGFHVREEKPMILNDASEPEPDIVVVWGNLRQSPYHPTPATAVLVMEVSDSTLAFDQNEKAAAYARGRGRLLDSEPARTQAGSAPRTRSGRRKRVGLSFAALYFADDMVTPLARPDVAIKVSDLLPTLLPPATEGNA